MKRYDGLLGGDDAGANGIYSKETGEMVLSSRELDALGVSLFVAVTHDWSDATIEDLMVRTAERQARNKAVWEARQRELGR